MLAAPNASRKSFFSQEFLSAIRLVFFAFAGVKYQLGHEAKMIRRAKMVFYTVPHSLKRVLAGFVVKMGIYKLVYLKALRKLRKAGRLTLFIKRRKMQHHYAHSILRQPVKAHLEPDKLALIYSPVVLLAESA